MKKTLIAARYSPSSALRSEELDAGVNAAPDKVVKYFDEIKDQRIYYAAVALNPVTRMLWFDDQWAGYDIGAWVKLTKAKFRKIYTVYRIRQEFHQQDIDGDGGLLLDTQSAIDNPLETPNLYKASTGLSSLFIQRKRKRIRTLYSDTEYARYVDFDYTGDRINDIPAWWSDHIVEFLVLSAMALDVLSIPAMEAEYERGFSEAGRLISDDRTSLGDESIESSLIQHHGLKTALFIAGVRGCD